MTHAEPFVLIAGSFSHDFRSHADETRASNADSACEPCCWVSLFVNIDTYKLQAGLSIARSGASYARVFPLGTASFLVFAGPLHHVRPSEWQPPHAASRWRFAVRE